MSGYFFDQKEVMTEPTTTTAVLTVGLSTTTLALFGVEYFALLWAFIGALFALMQSQAMGRWRAVFFVAISTLIGAALGSGFVDVVQTTSRPILILAVLIGGAGAQTLIGSILKAAQTRIDGIGGGS